MPMLRQRAAPLRTPRPRPPRGLPTTRRSIGTTRPPLLSRPLSTRLSRVVVGTPPPRRSLRWIGREGCRLLATSAASNARSCCSSTRTAARSASRGTAFPGELRHELDNKIVEFAGLSKLLLRLPGVAYERPGLPASPPTGRGVAGGRRPDLPRPAAAPAPALNSRKKIADSTAAACGLGGAGRAAALRVLEGSAAPAPPSRSPAPTPRRRPGRRRRRRRRCLSSIRE